MERWAGKVAVVTGASAGIGLATAKAFVQNGLIVVGLARRLEKMEKEMSGIVGKEKFYAKKCDITKEYEVAEIFKWIQTTFGSVHILINNAGIYTVGSIIDVETSELENVLSLNVMGLLHCTRHAVRLMKKNENEAHVVNINSVIGHYVPANPISHICGPAKFAVRAISEVCSNELRDTKIRVSNLSLGLVKTEIFEANNVDKTFFKDMPELEPEDVANCIIYVVGVPQHVHISQLTIKPFGEITF